MGAGKTTTQSMPDYSGAMVAAQGPAQAAGRAYMNWQPETYMPGAQDIINQLGTTQQETYTNFLNALAQNSPATLAMLNQSQQEGANIMSDKNPLFNMVSTQALQRGLSDSLGASPTAMFGPNTLFKSNVANVLGANTQGYYDWARNIRNQDLAMSPALQYFSTNPQDITGSAMNYQQGAVNQRNASRQGAFQTAAGMGQNMANAIQGGLGMSNQMATSNVNALNQASGAQAGQKAGMAGAGMAAVGTIAAAAIAA